MVLRINNPAVVKKVEQLAKATGLSNVAVVELAIDRLIGEITECANSAGRMGALLAQFDRIPDMPAAFDPLAWDEHGLPQ